MNTKDDIIVQGDELIQHLTSDRAKGLSHYVACVQFIMEMDPGEALISYKSLKNTYPVEVIEKLLVQLDGFLKIRGKFERFDKFSGQYIFHTASEYEIERAGLDTNKIQERDDPPHFTTLGHGSFL